MLLALDSIMTGLLVVAFLIVSGLMILIVLIQRPHGGGLSEAFGSSSGSGNTAFGAKTGDALTTATIGIFILFLGVAVLLNFVVRPYSGPPQGTTATSATEEQTAPAGQGAPVEGQQVPVTPVEGTPPFLQPDQGQPQGAEDGAADETQDEDAELTEPEPEQQAAPADEPAEEPDGEQG